MNKAEKQEQARHFKQVLEHSATLARARVADHGVVAGHRLLSDWQCNRLKITYEDLYSQRRYRKALDFFLTDLYGPVDFSKRDEDIARVYPLMVKVLSAEAIESLSQGLLLNSLTMELDEQLLTVLMEELGVDPDDPATVLDFELYAEAYRRCDNRDHREQQIDLIIETGTKLADLTRQKMILMAVKVARRPAKMAGFGELQSFIERGLSGFRAMGSPEVFLSTVESRERRLLEAIFANAPLPADIKVA